MFMFSKKKNYSAYCRSVPCKPKKRIQLKSMNMAKIYLAVKQATFSYLKYKIKTMYLKHMQFITEIFPCFHVKSVLPKWMDILNAFQI